MTITCADLKSNARAKLYIGASGPTGWDQTGLEAWIATTGVKQIEGASTIPNTLGPTQAIQEFPLLAEDTVCKSKGRTNYGQATPTIFRVDADPGQALLDAAVASNAAYYFAIQMADATATKTVPTRIFFSGLATQWQEGEINGNGLQGGQATIEALNFLRVERHAT